MNLRCQMLKSNQKRMVQKTCVFPIFVSDHDGIPHMENYLVLNPFREIC